MSYYDDHAAAYIRQTIDLDMSGVMDRFLSYLETGARILDAGCGPGRDARRFRDLGYAVTAFDPSPAMVLHARSHAGVPVRLARFQDLSEEATCDGIWCCASLLHVPEDELPDVLDRLAIALRPGGILYASFKVGTGTRHAGERWFTDQTQESFRALLAGQPTLEVLELWETADVRDDRRDQRWLNALVRKRELPEDGSGPGG